MTKVFVSGCFDMLHSGHIAFLEEASEFGDLYVGIGSDITISLLKGRPPVNTEQERLYMIRALRMVKNAWISMGTGILDFADDLKSLKPDVFFVNSDGTSFAKEKLCCELGIKLVVSERTPHSGLPARSTTSYRQECRIPYRVDIAGGWLDQPKISSLCPGSVITLAVEPDIEFIDLAGMATSTRKAAIELWGTQLPAADPIKTARSLFCFENPPGKIAISGSQDSIGMVLPGLNRLDYAGDFWPEEIHSCQESDILSWLEEHLRLIFVKQREKDYDPYKGSVISRETTAKLSGAADLCWRAILEKDLLEFSKAFLSSFEAQVSLFPEMLTPEVRDAIEKYGPSTLAWKMVGAGGGGYMLFVVKEDISGLMSLRARRNIF